MRIGEILDQLEALAPPGLQEDYDNSGLLTGEREAVCTGVLITLDCTEDVVEEAIAKGLNLIIAHHPVIFSGLKRLTGRNYVERTVIRAIRSNIAIYSIHTNLDNVQEGVNAEICRRIGISKPEILLPKSGILRKLKVFCPETHAEQVRSAMFAAGAGQIGKYSECSYNTEGLGTFRAGEEADPFVGETGSRHTEREVKVETVYPAYLETSVLKAMKMAHPYEEVAFDLVQLQNDHQGVGAGMIGELDADMEEPAFLQMLKEKMELSCIRYTVLRGKRVRKVAVCGGSGSFLLKKAMNSGADAFVTADFKYHQFFDAEGRILIADIGHFESERFTVNLLTRVISEKFPIFAVRISENLKNPVNYLI